MSVTLNATAMNIINEVKRYEAYGHHSTQTFQRYRVLFNPESDYVLRENEKLASDANDAQFRVSVKGTGLWKHTYVVRKADDNYTVRRLYFWGLFKGEIVDLSYDKRSHVTSQNILNTLVYAHLKQPEANKPGRNKSIQARDDNKIKPPVKSDNSENESLTGSASSQTPLLPEEADNRVPRYITSEMLSDGNFDKNPLRAAELFVNKRPADLAEILVRWQRSYNKTHPEDGGHPKHPAQMLSFLHSLIFIHEIKSRDVFLSLNAQRNIELNVQELLQALRDDAQNKMTIDYLLFSLGHPIATDFLNSMTDNLQIKQLKDNWRAIIKHNTSDEPQSGENSAQATRKVSGKYKRLFSHRTNELLNELDDETLAYIMDTEGTRKTLIEILVKNRCAHCLSSQRIIKLCKSASGKQFELAKTLITDKIISCRKKDEFNQYLTGLDKAFNTHNPQITLNNIVKGDEDKPDDIRPQNVPEPPAANHDEVKTAGAYQTVAVEIEPVTDSSTQTTPIVQIVH